MPKSDYKFFFPFRVRYAETDAQGIVFFAHYLTYFDTAINEYFRDLPYNYIEHVKRTGADFHVVKAGVEFYAPSHFDDEIEVYLRTGRIGRSSLTFVIEIFPKGGDTALVKGEVVWVNTDQTSKKSTPLPATLIQRLKVKEDIMTKKVTIIGAASEDQDAKGLIARLIEAAVAKDEDTFKACLAENSLEMITVDQMALEGNTVTFGDVTAEGELFIVPTTAADEKSSDAFTFVVREENGELRVDMQATMERMMGM